MQYEFDSVKTATTFSNLIVGKTQVKRGVISVPATTASFLTGAVLCRLGTLLGHNNLKVPVAVTADESDETFTLTAHGLVVGDIVRFQAGTTPTGLPINVDLFVNTVPTADTFTVSQNPGGSTAGFTANGATVKVSRADRADEIFGGVALKDYTTDASNAIEIPIAITGDFNKDVTTFKAGTAYTNVQAYLETINVNFVPVTAV